MRWKPTLTATVPLRSASTSPATRRRLKADALQVPTIHEYLAKDRDREHRKRTARQEVSVTYFIHTGIGIAVDSLRR